MVIYYFNVMKNIVFPVKNNTPSTDLVDVDCSLAFSITLQRVHPDIRWMRFRFQVTERMGCIHDLKQSLGPLTVLLIRQFI